MDTETTPAMSEKRSRLGPFGRVAVVCLFAISIVAVVGSLIVNGQVDEFTLIIAAFGVVPGLLELTGWRWAMVLVAILATLLTIALALFAGPSLSRPHDPEFLLVLPIQVFILVAAVASWGAVIQKLRGGGQWAPGWLNYALVGTAGLLIGAIAVGLIPQQGSVAGINSEALVDLPEISTHNFNFDQHVITVTAGETVAIRLENHDGSAHMFDIDELDVHAPMPPNETSLAFFKPTEPGMYRFYCSVPGHANLAEDTGMVGTLIVKPAS